MKLVDHTTGRVHEYEGQTVEQLKDMAKALKTDHFSVQDDDGVTLYREMDGNEIKTDVEDTDGEDDAA